MKPLVSVHVVHYSCSNCGEETEEVRMCKECSAPTRVIQVAELYGEEANEYLEKLKEGQKSREKESKVSGLQFDDSISGFQTEEEEVEEIDGTDEVELGEIFPEEEDDEKNPGKKYVSDLGDDFEAALDILDQEDDDLGDDIEDLPEL